MPIKIKACSPDPVAEQAKRLAYMALFAVAASLTFSNAIFEISSCVFMALALFSMIRSRDFSFLKSPWVFLMLFYFLINVASITQSQYLATSLQGLFRVFRCIVLCLSAVYVVDSEDKFKKIFEWFLVVAALVCVDALIQGATGFELIRQRSMTAYSSKTSRITGPFHHANDFSAYLSLVFFIFLALCRAVGKRRRPKGLFFIFWARFWC